MEVEPLSQLSQDGTSLLCPYGPSAAATHDVLACVRRYVCAPLWLTSSVSVHDNPTAIHILDHGSPTPVWRLDQALPDQPVRLPILTPYGYQKALVLGGAYTSHGSLPWNAASGRQCFLWTRRGLEKFAPLCQERSNFPHATTGSAVIVTGGHQATNMTMEVLGEHGWKLHQLLDTPPLCMHWSVVTHDNTMLLFGDTKSANSKIRVDSLHENRHVVDLETLSSVSVADYELPHRSVAWQACSTPTGAQLSDGSVYVIYTRQLFTIGYDVRESRSRRLCNIPRYFNEGVGCVAHEGHSICLFGKSKLPATDDDRWRGPDSCLTIDYLTRRSAPSCYVYDSRADAWFEEPRWSTGDCGPAVAL